MVEIESTRCSLLRRPLAGLRTAGRSDRFRDIAAAEFVPIARRLVDDLLTERGLHIAVQSPVPERA